MKKVFLSLLVIIGYLSMVQLLKAEVTLEYNELTGMEGLYFWYSDPSLPVAKYNRNITPKGDCFDVVNGYAFLTWYKGGMENRNLMVSRLKLGTNNWVTVQFPEQNSLYSDGSGDSHKTTSIGISSLDGTVHLAYNMHSGKLKYRVSKKGIAFGPDEDFTLENFFPQRDYLKSGEPIPSCTYPSFITNDAGELVFDFRIGTSRQGDLNAAYYNGDAWSSVYTIVKGNNVNPQFNLYGHLAYCYGRMYMIGSIRVYGSDITYNQGVYFGISGQRGNETWYNIAGQSYQIPLSNTLTPFKVAEPLPDGHDGMTSSANGLVTKNGFCHFTAPVNGDGIYHYIKPANSNNLIKGKAPGTVTFSAGGRVYISRISNSLGRYQLESTPEDSIDWETEIGVRPGDGFSNIVSRYYMGKLYVIAAEKKSSDKHPFRFLIFDLGVDESPQELHYPLDGDATEAGRSGHDGMLIGGGFAPSLVEHDQGLMLDGVDDYVEIAGYQGVKGKTSRTCAAWIRTTQSPGEIITWGNSDPGAKWIVRVNETGSLRTEVQGGYIYGTTPINDGLWHHVAAVLDSDGASADISDVQLYVDGQLDTVAGVLAYPIDTAEEQDVSIGVYTTVGLRYFQGMIDDVRIYSYALTPHEIRKLSDINSPSPDIVDNDFIDLGDLSALSAYWLDTDCFSNNLCDGRDLNADQSVDHDDLLVLIQQWLMPIPESIVTVGMNFGDATAMGSSEEAGAPGFEQTHWNSKGGDNSSLNNLVDGQGIPTTISMSWTANSTHSNSAITDSPGNHRMMRDYLDTNNDSTTAVTISNIPFDNYALVIYTDGDNVWPEGTDNQRNGRFTVVDPSDDSVIAGTYVAQDAPGAQFDGTFIETTPLVSADDATTPAGNYLVIEGLTASTIRLDATGGYNTDSTSHPRAALNAIQIIGSVEINPSMWTSQDIGDVAASGSTVDDGGMITIEGSGSDIWLTADEFHYYSIPFSGDGEIITRVVSQTNTHTWAKAGVMIRETLDPESKHAAMVVTPGEGSSFQRRPVTGDISYSTTPGNGLAAPAWVKMVRSGNTFTGYSSTDGTNWTQIGTDTVAMAADVYVGLCVTSHNDGGISTATFTDTEISQ